MFHKNNLIAQANKLIEARYTITKNEQLLLFAMISLINPKDEQFLTFTTTTEQLAQILGIHPSTALREFNKLTNRLMSRVITVNLPTEWEKLQWISNAKLDGNIISLKFHDDLKPFLLELKKTGNFTQMRLGVVIHFRSVYTIRIYQLLKEYASKRMSYFEFSVEEIRNMLLNEQSKKYLVFGDFKKWVLNIAKKELEIKDPETNLYKSDLSFTLETRRTGRKITHLKFIIKTQQTQPVIPIEVDSQDPRMDPENPMEYNEMIRIGVSERQALIFLEQYGPEEIIEKLELLIQHQGTRNIRNPAGFFIKALKEGWQKEALDFSQAGLKKWANSPENRTRTAGKMDNEIIAMMKYDSEKFEPQTLDFSPFSLSQWANSLANRTHTMGKSNDEIIAMMREELKKSKY